MFARACAVALAVVSFATLLGNARADERPNILWLTSEDNSAHWLGCYGNEHAQTPNLDRLASEGFRYTHCYANAPVCAPMRSTWITGVLSLSMGTHPMRSRYAIPHDQIKYYPDYLRVAGYHAGNHNKTDFNLGGRPDADCWDDMEWPNWQKLKTQQPFFQILNYGSSHESSAFGEVDQTDHDPQEVNLAAYHPDVPDLRNNYAHYHDAIRKMDGQIGDALKRLEEAGLAENTIVVYCSDHGGVMPRSKRFLFHNGLHCPLIVRIPERYRSLWPAEERGATIDRLVRFVDMPKTWLSLAGCDTPEYLQGATFLGPETEPEPPVHLAYRGRTDERIDNARAVCDKRFLYLRNYMPYTPWLQRLEYLWRMKATRAWEGEFAAGRTDEVHSRFFKPKGWTEELYDTKADPDCVNNLIDRPEHQGIAADLRRQLGQRQIEIHDAGLLPETEMARLAKANGVTIYEAVRNPELYDVAELLDAADLALEANPENLPELQRMLESPQLGQRYWGLVGCFLLDHGEAGLKAIDDPSHEVRAMAAWLLIRTGEQERGLACLRELVEQRSYALLMALNVIDWIGEPARALMPAVHELELVETYRKQYEYPKRMREHLIQRFGA
ncbi:Arylsulfatase [Planctomycetes bacterium MalM25]|nr:Arylsulfatase [Planctomycetes bacterium MalM25]